MGGNNQIELKILFGAYRDFHVMTITDQQMNTRWHRRYKINIPSDFLDMRIVLCHPSHEPHIGTVLKLKNCRILKGLLAQAL